MSFGSIAIGVRIWANVRAEFFRSYSDLLMGGLRDGDAVLPPAVRLPHSCACNFLAESFFQSECDSILFLDDDMDFRPSDLDVMRDTGEYDILSGLCVSRRGQKPVMHLLDKEAKEFSVDPNGVCPCDVAGLAFTLVRRSVFDALGYHNIFRWDNVMGEDGAFCCDAKAKGFSVGVHTGVSVGHVMDVTVRHEVETGKNKYRFEDFGVKKMLRRNNDKMKG